MHEFSLADSMLQMILKQVERSEAQKVEQVNLRIGRLSGVVSEALTFAFEALAEGTPAQVARLAIEDIAVTCYCPWCAHEFAVEGYSYRCPACQTLSREVRKGREMDLVSIEVS